MSEQTKTEPRSTHIVWADFGAEAATILERIRAVQKWLNDNRVGGWPKYRFADAVRTILLSGLEVCEGLMKQAEAE